MKTIRILPLLFATILFTGCGTPKVWYQEGKSFDEIRRTLAGCRVEAARANNPLAMVNGWFFIANEGNKKELIKNCMIAQGYSLVEKNSLPLDVVGVPED